MSDFITIEEVSAYVGRDLSADDSAAFAVSAACDTVRTLTEQDFNAVTETVYLDGSGTDTLLLPQVPVTAAGTVVVNGGTLSGTADYTVTEDGKLYRTTGTATLSSWSQGCGPSGYWPQGRRNIAVTYEHGYSGTVPSDVRMVALAIANRIVTQGGATQESVGQVSKTYAVSSTDLTKGELAILRKYKVSQ